MKIRLLVLLAFLMINDSFSAESKVLNKIKQFLPTTTEIGFLTGIVNCYVQASQFVRSTNKLVQNVKMGKQSIDDLRDQMTYMYYTTKSLKNINPYDMNTWTTATSNAEHILSVSLPDAIRMYNNTEVYLVDGTLDYLNNIETPEMYKDFLERNNVSISKYYLTDDYRNAIKVFDNMNKNQIKTQLLEIDASMNIILKGRTFDQLNTSEKEEYQKYAHVKGTLETQLLEIPNLDRNKLDSIVDETRNMMAVNLLEVTSAESRIKAMESAEAELVNAYDNIIQGNIRTKITENKKVFTNLNTNTNNYGLSANQVPFPSKPDSISVCEAPSKKEANQQDAIALQNNIKFLQYKQECLCRDVVAMKVNTMAFIVALEALKQYKTEDQLNTVCAQSLRTSSLLKKGKL